MAWEFVTLIKGDPNKDSNFYVGFTDEQTGEATLLRYNGNETIFYRCKKDGKGNWLANPQEMKKVRGRLMMSQAGPIFDEIIKEL